MICHGHQIVEWAQEQMGVDYGMATGIGVLRGNLKAAVIFNEWNGANVNIHVVSDGSRKWLSRSLLGIVFDYAFDDLKAKRCTAPISSKNEEAQRLVTGIGFDLEAVLQDAHPDGDLLIYVMRPPNKWSGYGKIKQ